MSKKSYEISTLETFPELVEQTNSLIESSFGYQNPYRFAADFAPLAGPHNFKNRHILFNPLTKTVLAHIGCHPRLFIWEGEVIPVVLIGGIAVDESERGQGLFKDMFLRVMAHYHSQCAFFLLWSDKHELYAKYDFYLAGRQWCYRVPGEDCKGELAQLNSLSPDVILEMNQLYQNTVNRRAFSPLRDSDDWERLKPVSSTELRLLKKHGKLSGYYFKNKGMDLAGVVHDWAHEEGVVGLLRDSGSPGVIWASENVEVPDHVLQDLQLVGLWRTNTHPMALKKLSGLLEGASVEWSDPYFVVKHSRGNYRLLPNDLIEEIFGNGKHGIRSRVLPVWIGGLDSI